MKKINTGICLFFFSILISQYSSCQPNREVWQPTEEILDSLGIKAGMIIGEIGAGQGYMTFPLVEKVGNEGKVYANDIDSWSLRQLKNRKERDNLENLEVVEGKTDDPLFPVKNLDMMILVYVFHDLTQPIEFTRNTKKYLKDSGSLVLIEKDVIKDPGGRGHFLLQKELLDRISKTGYKLRRIETFLEKDNIYIFEKE
ncbi:MAG: class I SAM-dependent methyltransferase [Prolixibacteraceae bacterium]|nr:class I SAM-dependent methyltransferase [Prolixibacteraceae bacterium]MBN2775275.1 class I SAM-dependent methyltransferase [Prolixibacteraceae bacterium]